MEKNYNELQKLHQYFLLNVCNSKCTDQTRSQMHCFKSESKLYNVWTHFKFYDAILRVFAHS